MRKYEREGVYCAGIQQSMNGMTQNGRKYTKLGIAIRIPATALVQYSEDGKRVHVFGSMDSLAGSEPFGLTMSIEAFNMIGMGGVPRIETLAEFKKSIK